MKFIKWRIWAVTCIVCLLPVILGIVLWDKLPETMAIHFDTNNRADGFASKGFAVVGLPVLMVLLQSVCCIINDFNAAKHGERKKLELVTKWIIPVMSMILYAITIWVNLGGDLDIRRIVCVIVAGVFFVTGNYMPKLDYIKDYDVDTQKARKINRFVGFTTVIMGVIMLASVFLPPIASIIALFLLIPYGILNIVYGIYIGKSNSQVIK